MHPLLIDAPGAKRLLLGNEAIVRGALQAGVGFVSTYPGTPSSEIGDTFFRLAVSAQIEFEYSVNEKVALEVAAGAAISGARVLCAMKHVGLNVAADPLMTLAYTGVRGGLVIITADDPGCHSSQNEQDNRYYALLSQLPMFDPATPQDAFEMTQAAFELSEKYELPVLVRTTTRVAHARGVITFGDLSTPVKTGTFIKEPRRFMPVPAIAKMRHPILRKQTAAIAKDLTGNRFDVSFGSGALGIIASGAGATYAEDLVTENDLRRRVRFLRIGVTHPLDSVRVIDFLRKVKRVLIVEELEPFIENQVKTLAHDNEISVKVFGKATDHLPIVGEFNPDIVADALFDLLKIKTKRPKAKKLPALPPRPPAICAGCPHRATYYLAKMAAGEDAVFGSDIGCYTLGFLPPLNVGDMFLCMGSSASASGGVATVTQKPIVAFIGDSTFFHSGMTGLANTIKHNRNVKLVVMDNRTTGMTGHQPHPGSSVPGDPSPELSIEAIVRAMGITNFAKINPMNLGESLAAVQSVLAIDGPGVIISRSPCPIYDRKVLRTQRKPVTYRVNRDVCKHCAREANCLDCNMDPHALTTLVRSMKGIESGHKKASDYLTDPPKKMDHPPCEAACPARICVQGYIARIAAGDTAGAIELIRQRVALPNSLCRICERPCETVCIRNDYDYPVAINRLKRFAMETETDADRAAYVDAACARIIEKGKKVAVIGAGPAGLQCAHDLRLRGFDVTVFEAAKNAGGIARWGIPAHRLPNAFIEKDLSVLAQLGVRFEFGKRFGEQVDTAMLHDQGFVAGFMSIGQPRGAALRIEGEKTEGVENAMAFLARVNSGGVRLKGTVVIIGGGNAAVDAARAAVRCKADKVRIIYRRTKNEMPAHPNEVVEAIEEGITIETLASPLRFESAKKRIRVVCQKMELSQKKHQGRRRPIPIQGKTVSRMADHVITAIGQSADTDALSAMSKKAGRGMRIIIDAGTGATADPFWFAGGDVVTGPASFVEALEAGKVAAYGIDQKLSGKAAKVPTEAPGDAAAMLKEKRYAPKNVAKRERVAPKKLSPKKRAKNFAEVEATYTADQAQKEAARCLTCGTCGACNNCIDNFGCPAFYKEGGEIFINPTLCDGCGTCVQICPNGAIELIGGTGRGPAQ